MPAIAISKPTIQVFVAELRVCGQTKAEMNNHTPSMMLAARGHASESGAGGVVGVLGVAGRIVVGSFIVIVGLLCSDRYKQAASRRPRATKLAWLGSVGRAREAKLTSGR